MLIRGSARGRGIVLLRERIARSWKRIWTGSRNKPVPGAGPLAGDGDRPVNPDITAAWEAGQPYPHKTRPAPVEPPARSAPGRARAGGGRMAQWMRRLGAAWRGAVGEAEDIAHMRRMLGRLLARARERAGLSQRDLARRAGCSRTAVWAAERGAAGAGLEVFAAADVVLGTVHAGGADRIRAHENAARAARDRAPGRRGRLAAWWRGAGRGA
jgi:DNA-binding XRE family transcriptional regulator